jgi:hypothetical protein
MMRESFEFDGYQGCTNPGCHLVPVTKFCVVAPNICGCSVCNLLHVTRMAARILGWILDFWKICALLVDICHNL